MIDIQFKMSPAKARKLVEREYVLHAVCKEHDWMNDDELEEAARDIQAKRLFLPIATSGKGGPIVDGKNRLAACFMIGKSPTFMPFKFDNDKQIREYSDSLNLKRRHYSASQLAGFAADREDLYKGSDSGPGRAIDKAAEDLNVSPSLAREAKAVKNKNGDLFEDIKKGKISVRKAAKKAKKAAKKAAGWDESFTRIFAPRINEAAKLARLESKSWRQIPGGFVAAWNNFQADVAILESWMPEKRTTCKDCQGTGKRKAGKAELICDNCRGVGKAGKIIARS